jgi:hypothetical protein
MLRLAPAALVFIFPLFLPVFAPTYYEEQTDFDERSVPVAEYRLDRENLQACVYKEGGVPNKYYVWAKLAVQDWRNALREYTGNMHVWNMSARYVTSENAMTGCDIKVYIYDTYRDFPAYPEQTGAYTSVHYAEGIVDEASVYLSPKVLHGDGSTEIGPPTYAFRNSAAHEIGHALGLSHNAKIKGYLMSPQFDFWEQDDQLPITTLELSTLVGVYGTDGFSG